MGMDSGIPNPAKEMAKEAVLNNAKNLANGGAAAQRNPDFAGGKGDDPHARGAESSCEFIMNN